MISTLFLVLALIAFLIGITPPPSRINWVSVGLALWAVSVLIARHIV